MFDRYVVPVGSSAKHKIEMRVRDDGTIIVSLDGAHHGFVQPSTLAALAKCAADKALAIAKAVADDAAEAVTATDR